MLTITDQIANPSSDGNDAGGIRAATPSTIATQPSHLGNPAPYRIARPLPIASRKAPPTTGRKATSSVMKLSV